jgi:MarR family transcriptional regulator for hemolysin
VRPTQVPIGLHLARTAKAVSRAFDETLEQVGGSTPAWLILLSLKTSRHRTQSDLAEAVGVRGPTLTHHLDALESQGLVVRERDPSNRRVQRVSLTAAGEDAFARMRAAAQGHDRRLRARISEDDLAIARRVLDQLAVNASTPGS